MYKLRQPVKELLPVVLAKNHAASSVTTLVPYAQDIKTCNLAKSCQFEYSEEKNLQKYNLYASTKYDLSHIIIPVSLHYADNVAQPLDVIGVYHCILKEVDLFRANYTLFNHLDFLWVQDVKVFVNNQIKNSIFIKTDFSGITKSSRMHDIFDPALKELNTKLSMDMSKVQHALQKQWENIQKKLPDWQKSIANKLELLQGYIQRKLDKEHKKTKK